MTFFNFFRKNPTENSTISTQVTLDPDLFRELAPPISENDWTKKLGSNELDTESNFQNPTSTNTESIKAKSNSTPIDEFMNKDYMNNGYNLGMEGANKEQLEIAFELIKSEFEFLLVRLIDHRSNLLRKLQAQGSGWESISSQLHQDYQNQIEQAERRIKELSEQKILCPLGEGWIRTPILQFKNGFIKGAKAFQELDQFSAPNFTSSINL